MEGDMFELGAEEGDMVEPQGGDTGDDGLGNNICAVVQTADADLENKRIDLVEKSGIRDGGFLDVRGTRAP